MIPIVCGGFPTRDATSLTLPAIERAGAPAVFIRIPASDSFGDGPVVADAMHESLAIGTTPASILAEVKSLREWMKIGLVAIASVTTAVRLGGPDRFANALAGAGFDGVVYVDIPFEVSVDWIESAANAGLVSTLTLTPSTSPARAEQILKVCRGFAWIAGATVHGAANVAGMVKRLREMTDLPLLVSGSAASAEQVRAIVRPGDPSGADAIVIEDEVLRCMGTAKTSGKDPVHAVEALLKDLNAGLTGRYVSAESQSQSQSQSQAIQQSA